MQETLTTLLQKEYASAVLLAIILFVFLLLFLVIYTRRALKKQSTFLNEQEEKIKSLRQYSYEAELKRVEREHEIEKELLALNHTIKELETGQKEGLKNQIVRKIEEYEKKRMQQLQRADIRL